MLVNLRYKGVRVRCPNSQLLQGEEKFNGSVTYSVVGSLDRRPVRLSLGTGEKNAAIRRVAKLEKACAEGAKSSLWYELSESLPVGTFKFFADRAGYVSVATKPLIRKWAWRDLCDSFELEMKRLIANKARGASRKEGVMVASTRDRYRQTMRHSTGFLDAETLLEDIKKPTIEMFKVDRHKKIVGLKQSRGGASVALDVAILHRIFKFGVSSGLMPQQPIDLSHESKPGENPKNGARPLTAEELVKLRKSAGEDLFMFLLLRWTGLRGSDALNLRWENVRFDRGTNGEIEVLTQKRSKIAIIPLSSELHNALDDLHNERKPRKEDQVLHNPEKGRPFTSRARLYERTKAMGIRAGVTRVTPHCFRDTFACDMLARGAGIFDVAKMLADTVETIETYYAQFVPAARDAAQSLMDRGVGIEERGKLAQQRGRKVVGFPG
jgi:integrase